MELYLDHAGGAPIIYDHWPIRRDPGDWRQSYLNSTGITILIGDHVSRTPDDRGVTSGIIRVASESQTIQQFVEMPASSSGVSLKNEVLLLVTVPKNVFLNLFEENENVWDRIFIHDHGNDVGKKSAIIRLGHDDIVEFSLGGDDARDNDPKFLFSISCDDGTVGLQFFPSAALTEEEKTPRWKKLWRWLWRKFFP